MRKAAASLVLIGGLAAVGIVPARAGGEGWGDPCCGAPVVFTPPLQTYAVTLAHGVRPNAAGILISQPMLVTVPAAPGPGYVVNQGQYPVDLPGVGVVPFGYPLAHAGYHFGYGVGPGYRTYRWHPY